MIQKSYHNTLLQAYKGDITQEDAQVIVNAANNALRGGGGVDGAIHRTGGPKILEECRQYQGCPTGEVRTTGAGRLQAQYVIHTVGPVYRGQGSEATLLANCYQNALEEAYRLKVESIAFPSISTGVYGYPIKEAAQIAVRSVLDFFSHNPEHSLHTVRFVLFSQSDYEIYYNALNQFIPEGP